MKKLLILGAGAGGTIVANKMREKLSEKEWEITVIDRDWQHHYQAGWLFVPFGIYSIDDCIKPKSSFIPNGVNFVQDTIVNVDPASKVVTCANGKYDYDWIVVGTGCRIVPEEVEGMMNGWRKDIHDFYTPDGAIALQKHWKYMKKGRVVLNIAEMPIKCPVAPLEFVYLADWFFTMNGVRKDIEIELVTPLTGPFTKPVATKILSKVCEEKNIKVTPNFVLDSVDADKKVLESVTGDQVDYDLLVSIPPNFGAQFLMDSEIADPMGYMDTDKHTLKSKQFDNMYIIGDATNVPTSKAGSVAHYEADIVAENLHREIEGEEPRPEFDGHSTCFIVSGYEQAYLIDFNYDVEPLPGKYPFPGLGPLSLLGESHMNYWGKMMFKWVYFNLMLKGHDLPLESQMFMAGKMKNVPGM
ncbi:type III sulfide quinone reductase, selenoprotein subtype [Desulfobaculum bizertense]|uniref:Sulfide:quinone oxidoreductase n=1 Tax=Desulfobaculum bizertense DSM 18034 TaxID=1121442 RepID=A0A1T4VPN7_9BACT|nr:FAD/NAD(P)-binding oxidoreductase [Desulfobaculum bizertense]UIJ38211.1 NAD(P)/FAD-dependent oxidoreductase [Desulfobaculum bizertense]SKA66808.1 sulfide:quinone oxidoreductase [Desulfobaculum bizertense DSM 18034]